MALLSDEQRARFDEEVARLLTRFPDAHKGAALLEVLHLVQEMLGWVPVEVMPLIAEKLDISPVQVREVTSFYTMYHLEKPGKHVVEVCTNVSCQALGADEIVEKVCKRFSIRPGETSADGKVTLHAVECLGSCGTAPMLSHNREYRENIDQAKLASLIEEIERG
jgi:NADH-quinone oxidoreductase subunit E